MRGNFAESKSDRIESCTSRHFLRPIWDVICPDVFFACSLFLFWLQFSAVFVAALRELPLDLEPSLLRVSRRLLSRSLSLRLYELRLLSLVAELTSFSAWLLALFCCAVLLTLSADDSGPPFWWSLTRPAIDPSIVADWLLGDCKACFLSCLFCLLLVFFLSRWS